MYKYNQLIISSAPEKGACIVYVMARDQRVADNIALVVAQQKALELHLPLVVIFNFHGAVGVRAYEHALFMVEGLKEVAETLSSMGIEFIITANDTKLTLEGALKKLDPAAIYFDFSPLHGPRAKAKSIAASIQKSTIVVDTHNIIPAWIASTQQEFAAHTFRYKVHRYLSNYLSEPQQATHHPYSLISVPPSLSFKEVYQYIEKYPKRSIRISYKPGEKEAHRHLSDFISEGLANYATGRNDLAKDQQSGFSPYLHFGQIYSLRIALEIMYKTKEEPLLYREARLAQSTGNPSITEGMNSLFEEMVVRKELADNFCLYSKSYRNFTSIPAWAFETLKNHSGDRRDFIYSLQDLESAQTHDESWNAAQRELTHCGKIHGYMRMYWAKKILEWTEDPETALRYAIYLNDAYSIDGGDPNGYVGVLWAIAGLHDRPWTERPVFGKIRYMNEAGLKRKFDIQKYQNRIPKTFLGTMNS